MATLDPILPEAALHQNIAVLGKNGSGKTFAAKAAIVEPLLAQGRRVGIVDPTGAWWGLRSSRDGKGPGFPVLVLGGDHGDLALPPKGGAAVARLLVEQGVNLVADTSQLTVGERTRWFTDFAGTLYRANKTPLHLILDEAHNFAPQGKVPDPDAGKMLHAASTLASQGRSRGIRLVMITQRPQKLHKDSLTSAETLIAMRVIAPHDRRAVQDWIDGCAGEDSADVIDTLAALPRGEGWVWYPEGNLLRRTKFPPIATFDSSATPMDGAPVVKPQGAAALDLTEIREAMAEAVKEAEANDPKLLRAEIDKLRKSIASADAPSLDREEVERRAHAIGWISPALRSAMHEAHGAHIGAFAAQVAKVADDLKAMAAEFEEKRSNLIGYYGDADPGPAATPIPPRLPPAPIVPRDYPRAPPHPLLRTAQDISRPQQRILDGLAWLKALGIDSADRVRAAMLADQSPRSSGYEKNLSTLKTAGLINYPAGGYLALTAAGEAAAAPPNVPLTDDALHSMIRQHVSGPQWRLLEALIAAHPKDLDRATLAERADASPLSSGFEKNVSTLRSLGFIDYPSQGRVVATSFLFVR